MRTYSKLERSRTSTEDRATKRRRISQESTPAIYSRVEGGSSNSIDSVASRSDVNSASDSILPSSSPIQDSWNPPNKPISRSSTPPSSPPRKTTCLKTETVTAKSNQHDGGHTPEGTLEASTRPTLGDADANRLKRPPAKQQKPFKFTQMHLDFGQKVRQRCKTCGMEYAPSIAEDAAVHKQFHNMNTGGVELGRAFVESDLCQSRSVWQGNHGDNIVECCFRDEKPLKNKVRLVLDVVDVELGAVKVDDDRLWAAAQKDRQIVLFKAYLYLRGSRCIGLCLIEDLHLAYKVLATDAEEASVAVSLSHGRALKTADKPDAVMRGVTRIWTSQNYRKEGLATQLLDCAQSHAVYGRVLPKEYFAFSQPTVHGIALARKWYGKDAGWHVYTG